MQFRAPVPFSTEPAPDSRPTDNGPWIQTYMGEKFYPLRSFHNVFYIKDIAHALSNICRFGGHTKQFYSVAEHCIRVSFICPSELALYGLLHDASEAYLGDLVRPLKIDPLFSPYRAIEAQLQMEIYVSLGLDPYADLAGVDEADQVMLHTEARCLMGPLHNDWLARGKELPIKFIPLGPRETRDAFVCRFKDLQSPGSGAYCDPGRVHLVAIEEQMRV